MNKILLTIVILVTMPGNLLSDQPETIINLETKNGTLEGTLLVPLNSTEIPIALIIAGSGSTDRNGNGPATKNNSLKMLATALWENQIASLRYDKRGIGKSQKAVVKEQDLRFEHYIADVEDWIELLRQDQRFSRIVVIGHSEGSLLGMIAAQTKTIEKFISIAGSGHSADKTLTEQLKSQPPEITNMTTPIIESLRQGKTVNDVTPMLYALFRPSVQPYLISWFKYDPAEEIAKLKMPVLVVQGSTDIQVNEKDALILAQAGRNVKVKIIKGMNHILKEADEDRMKNIRTYNQPQLPIMKELIDSVVDFIK